MSDTSLHQRLGRGIALGLLLLMGLQYLAVDWAMQHLTQQYLVSRLEHDQESLLLALRLLPDGVPLLDQQRISPTFQRPLSGHYYLIQTPTVSLASRSLWEHHLPAVSLSQGKRQVVQVETIPEQPLLVLQAGFEKQGQVVTLSVAEDLSVLKKELQQFRWQYALFSLCCLLVLLGLQRWLLHLGLKPLQALTQQLKALQQAEIAQLNPQVPVELQPVVTDFNALLDLLKQRLQRSREALGDLSHALKRPLTRMYQLLEKQPWPELEQEVQRINGLIEQELQRARMAGSGTPGLSCQLDEALSELRAVLDPLYAEKHLQLEVMLPAHMRLGLERQDLLELLGNLLENAYKWARQTIWVRAGTGVQGSWLEIEDDGPGCPPERLEELRERGVRADQRVPGHGLGLAIAQRLVEGYQGRMELANTGSGFRVRIDWPAKSC